MQESAFRILDNCPVLKRVYVTSACIADDGHFDSDEFLQLFFDYFGLRNSSFFNRLELLSYHRTLWQIVSAELDDAELADMEYELQYEPLSDGELEELTSGTGLYQTGGDSEPSGEESIELSEEGHDYDHGNDEGDDDDLQDEGNFCRWLTQPGCYTWGRVRSGFSRMPLKTSWMDYRNDELAWTVSEFVFHREPLWKLGPSATFPVHDDWADVSDAGLGDYEIDEP